MAGKTKSNGATSRAVRENHKRLRLSRDMTWAQESRFLKKLGWDIPALALRRIEDGERRVDVDDLMALAVVLDVSPVELLLDEGESGKTDVTGIGTVPSADALAWTKGEKPLLVEEAPGRGRVVGYSSNPLVATIEFEPTEEDAIERFLSSDRFKKAVRDAMRDDV